MIGIEIRNYRRFNRKIVKAVNFRLKDANNLDYWVKTDLTTEKSGIKT